MTASARVAIGVAMVALSYGGPGLQAQGGELPKAAFPASLARTIDPVIDTLWWRFSRRRAIAHVRYISQFWRIGGNAGYDASIERVRARLVAAGFSAQKPGEPLVRPSTWIEEYPNGGKGWSYSAGTLAVAREGEPDEVVLSRDRQHVALCINSFSTPEVGLLAPLVDVGKGDTEADYAGKSIKGAVVLGDAEPAQLWRLGVVAHGAIGIVSTALSRVVSPDLPGASATPHEDWDILQWGAIPYDEGHHGFGFKASPRAAAALRQALGRSTTSRDGRTNAAVRVRVTIASSFTTRPVRTLVAEIPGRVAPAERIVIAAHVQEPGANDNASGVATLVELARALRLGIAGGRIPRPDRTLTFLWLEEISGSRQWLKDHPQEGKNVRYMFSMDMTGEDVKKTGGSFLIERWPDPGAVWDRPWDPHTEWGRGEVRADQLKGDVINDLHLAVCLRVARKTGWTVKTNPYEGGSDHSVFGMAGVPAVLDWHFTDRYYHTNLDTPDKTSAAEMRNVGVAVAASAWLLASANESTALAVADLVAKAGDARLSVEQQEGPALAAADADPRMASIRQVEIVATWRKWYAEAVRSASRLVVGPVSAGFASQLEGLAAPFDKGK